MIFLTWSAAVIIFLTVTTFVVDLIISAPKASGPESDHYNGKTFFNPDKAKPRGLKDIIIWSVTGDPGEWQKITQEEVNFSKPDKVISGDRKAVITFVNHATFLIQTNGMNILTDPIWSERASPFQWVGPKRMRPPGIRFEDLPSIDLVLISHNHYDHLDINSIINLHAEHESFFILPIGVGEFLKETGIYNYVELDWWQQHQVNSTLTINGVPARHFSGRGITDRDKTLWCGYVLELPDGNIYFAGDTGYDGFFTEINRRFTPIHTALIPIGAYRPRWFMEPIHLDPEEAVKVHREVGAKQSIGMHFGTFPLADDGMTEPLEDLVRARGKHGISEEAFRTLQEGESLTIRFSPQKLASE